VLEGDSANTRHDGVEMTIPIHARYYFNQYQKIAETIPGFMLEDELMELCSEAQGAKRIVEIGSFLGRSTIVLAAAVKENFKKGESLMVSIDHHRGSTEHRAGGAWQIKESITPDGTVDTLDGFRNSLKLAGVEDIVTVLAMDSRMAARQLHGHLDFDMVFIDGSHDSTSVMADLMAWQRLVNDNGKIVVHDYDPHGLMRPNLRGVTEAVDRWFEHQYRTGEPWEFQGVKGGTYGTLAVIERKSANDTK